MAKNAIRREVIKIVPKENFDEIFLDNRLTFSDKIDIFLSWKPDIDIPDEITTSEQLCTFIYDIYLKSVEKYNFHKAIRTIEKKKNEESRKDFIINFIESKGECKYQDLYDAVDDKWQYEARGKTARVRINNTLKELIGKNLIARDGEIIIWKGK